MGQRLLRGRLIDEHDTPAFRHVPVVNETFAQKYFKNESPLGRHFGLGSAKHSLDYEMAGVVKDAKWRDPYEPPGPMFFLPLMQESAEQWQESPGFELYQLHRTARRREPGKPRTLVRKAIAKIEPNLTVIEILPFDELVSLNFNQERLIGRLTSAFGILALLLASGSTVSLLIR
jgi:macrolide transport system ATP-binding/permease protein